MMFERLRPTTSTKTANAEGGGASVKAESAVPDASPGAARGSREARGRERPVVGLDIQPGLLVAAKCRVEGRLLVERAAYTPLALDVVRDGEVNNIPALGRALAELFHTSRLERRVRIGIANQRIVMRRISLPPLVDAKEIDLAVRFQAQDEIPMPLDSVVLDYRSLGIVASESGPRLDVLLVAARRDMVERVLEAASLAGLRVDGVDLAAFGMVRALRPADADPTTRILYLAIGGMTNLAISQGSTCEFTRVIASGVEQIAADVASRCGVSLGEARRLVSSAGTASSLGPTQHAPLAPAPPIPGAYGAPGSGSADIQSGGIEPLEIMPQSAGDRTAIIRTTLTEGIRRIAAEVRNSLDFYVSAQGEGPVARGVLCGPALEIAGFEAALSGELGIPVARGAVALASSDAAGGVPTSLIAVAAGLSVSEGPS
ncbi:MAG: pilus assembly protein PilM [Solirubrobacteraceae bacterium]|jgi:type IV pilus assembly protein PilM